MRETKQSGGIGGGGGNNQRKKRNIPRYVCSAYCFNFFSFAIFNAFFFVGRSRREYSERNHRSDSACVLYCAVRDLGHPLLLFFFVSKEKHNGTTRNEELAVIKSRIRARGKYSHHLLFFVFLFFNLCFFFTAVHLKIVNGHA